MGYMGTLNNILVNLKAINKYSKMACTRDAGFKFVFT